MKNKANLDQTVIYQIFVRNYSKEGTIRAVINDLPRLQRLGVDILQLLPVHPIGLKGRKGEYGSPYATTNYREISPDLGTMEDLEELFATAHRLNMKVIMDMVFNHTARDAVYLTTHPEWYYRNEKGEFANKVGDWSDVYDFDHEKAPESLSDFLIDDVLGFYVKKGCDGFRFDVGSLLPKSFWIKAREHLDKINDDLFFLCEAVDSCFVLWNRSQGIACLSNAELIDAGFDALYHYASFQWLGEYLREKDPIKLEMYKAAFNVEAAQSGSSASIVRALENHDQLRIASYGDIRFTKELLRFTFFTKGPAFVYAGEEYGLAHKPELFEKDPLDLTKGNEEIYQFVASLIQEKHQETDLRTSEILASLLGTLRVKNTYADHETIRDFDLRFDK